jgi:antitoxin VapB
MDANGLNMSFFKLIKVVFRSRRIQSLYTFSWEVVMSIGTVFVNNRTQAVRLPMDVRLPEGVQKVDIRIKGKERIIAPLGQSWDSFFLDGPKVSEDFLPERANQHQQERVPALEVENWVHTAQ